jgi:integrase
VITKIGIKAGIVVDEGNPDTGSSPKYASTHDLRRTFGQRMADENIEMSLLTEQMRHQSEQTTKRYYISRKVQKTAEALQAAVGRRLKVVG